MFPIVLFGENSSAKHWDAHGPEVFGTDQMDLHRRPLVGWRFRLTFDHERSLPVIAAERQTRRNAHRLRTGQGAESLQQIPVKIDLRLFLSIFLFRQIEAKAQHSFARETGIDLLQSMKTPEQQAG